MSHGLLFVVSAPSGTGKTTLCGEVLQRVAGLVHSVSYTTRSPRPAERDGVDYHFVTFEAFCDKVEKGELVEWVEIHGQLYGTGREVVERDLAEGKDLLLAIETEGARRLKSHFPGVISIFLLPPSLELLEKRLRERKTEDEDEIRRRMTQAREEIKQWPQYDYVIVNDRLEQAAEELRAIVMAERCRSSRLERHAF